MLGFSFGATFYMHRFLWDDECLVQFLMFSTFLEWVFKTKFGLKGVIHYLDDFLFMGASSFGQCLQLLHCFETLAGELGVPFSPEKTEGPCQ